MEDNKVRLFTSSIDEEGKRRYTIPKSIFRRLTQYADSTMLNPQIFRPGDIVEDQLLIIAVAMKNGQKKMKLKLRSVTFVDEEFTKASNHKLNHIQLTSKMYSRESKCCTTVVQKRKQRKGTVSTSKKHQQLNH